MNIQGSMKRRSPLASMLLLSIAILQAHGQLMPDSYVRSINDNLKEVNVELISESPTVMDYPGVKGRTEEAEVVYRQNNKYKWKSVKVKLLDGKSIDGKLISVTGDSLVIQHGHGSKKIQRRIGYSEIAFVGIHRNGAGGLGGLVGGLAGGGIGYLVAYKEPQSSSNIVAGAFNSLVSQSGGFIGVVIGAVAGTCVGAAIGSSHKKHPIDGNKEKFELLLKKIAKQGGTEKILPKGN